MSGRWTGFVAGMLCMSFAARGPAELARQAAINIAGTDSPDHAARVAGAVITVAAAVWLASWLVAPVVSLAYRRSFSAPVTPQERTEPS